MHDKQSTHRCVHIPCRLQLAHLPYAIYYHVLPSIFAASAMYKMESKLHIYIYIHTYNVVDNSAYIIINIK